MEPSIADLFTRALAEHQRHALPEAETLYRKILSRQPNHSAALDGLGILACEAGHHSAGIALLQRAISLDPSIAEYHAHLALAFSEIGRHDQASRAFQLRAQLQPSSISFTDLGRSLRQSGNLLLALNACRRAVQLDPHSADAHRVLGDVLHDLNDLDTAEDEYQTSIRLDPNVPEVRSALASVYKKQVNIDRAIQTAQQAAEIAQRVRPPEQVARHLDDVLLLMHYDPSSTPADILAAHEPWTRALSTIEPQRTHPNERSSDRRLRIGYVSPDLNDHPVGRFLLPLLENHNCDQFHVFCYSDTLNPDSYTKQLQRSTDVWRETSPLSSDQLATLIAQDQIDLLIDLTLHTANNRLPTFARKPAPVQLTWLAYAGTSGLPTMDYRITDPYLDPPNSADYPYSEKSLYLTHCYWCYKPPPQAPPISNLPALAGVGVTFSCLNNYLKLSSPALDLFARILVTVPHSHLALLAEGSYQQQRVLDAFKKYEISPNRVRFLARQSLSAFLQSHSQFDIALDPFPFNGGTTTCDALWMGVPLITLAGQSSVARAGVSILTNAGLTDLIAATPDHYIQLALALANDLPRLQHLRRTLRDRLIASPLCNAPAFARDIERLYRTAWKSSHHEPPAARSADEKFR
jgi:protein O-GlcNAc transferase